MNHEHVIQQLSEFGVPSFYLRLLRAYLDSHQQIVVFEGQDYPIGMPQLGFEMRVFHLSVANFKRKNFLFSKNSNSSLSDGVGIPQGGRISAFVWNVFFASIYEAKFSRRLEVTFADDDGLVIEYDEIDERLVYELRGILESVEEVAVKIGITFGVSKTQILVIDEDVPVLKGQLVHCPSFELRQTEVTDVAKWLGVRVRLTREGLSPEPAASLLAKSTSVVSQFQNFCVRYSGPAQLPVRRQVYQTFILPILDYTVLTFFSKYSDSDQERFHSHERRMWDLVYSPLEKSAYGDLVKLRLVPLVNRVISRQEVIQRHYYKYRRDPRVQHQPACYSVLYRVVQLVDSVFVNNYNFREELKILWKRSRKDMDGTGEYTCELENLPAWLASIYVPYCPRLRKLHKKNMERARALMLER